MNSPKSILLSFLMMLMFAGSYNLMAQEAVPTDQPVVNQVDESTEREKKAEKKKDKDVVEINQNFFIYLGINLATLVLIILLVYFPQNRQFESIFTFLMFNLMIFMLTFVLNKIKISVGAAFGLFAVFSMLRYRTEGISMKDMTYLFIFIAVGLISAIQLGFQELLIINAIIFAMTFFLDSNIFLKRESSKLVKYENIELVKPENQSLMLEDLRKRTGINIHRFQVQEISFLRDTADVKIYFYEKKK